ncbi:MAG TPA: hypothetical protein VF649_03580 [Sphingomonas sp.]|jgi:hypothetical protein|uniref:hypothetical protein n=1 Tax=Sphingomonas sp. TaxID=28214 RepID=UPI002ED8268F
MSKSSHVGEGDGLTQNQNNAMSDDPGDGQRRRYSKGDDASGVTGAPDAQGPEQLAAFGRRGSRQSDDGDVT